jgi:CBS domain-containing protein
MPAMSNATPLIALDAVVIDSETTSLDPRKARIVELGGVRLVSGRVRSDDSFRHLVRPDEPIPPAASALHHIDDAKVADAPAFAEVWPALLAFVGNAVLIGHTLGFDLAVLKRECERAWLPFFRPRTLDTRLLAEVAEPDLADYTLEALASWLGIEIADRHSALGDALITARIFTALVPKLRDGNIRTLGEAMQACRALTNVLDEQHRAGWVTPAEQPLRADAERTFARIDSYPYRHRIRDVMRSPAQFVTADTPVAAALAQLMRERISSLYVRPPQGGLEPLRASETGIVTERDILRALAGRGGEALRMPVAEIMSKPLAAVPADAFVYVAIGRMSRLGVRHLGAVDEAGHVIGALSARDLLRLRASEAVALEGEIGEALDVHALGTAWAKLPHVAGALSAEAVSARDVAAVISRELGALTRQAAVIAEARLREAGRGGPPCPYAVAVLGSAGRGESLLALDQDNALVFADGAPGGGEDAWFGELGRHVADILHEVGVPYCKGGVMAKNPQWRGSLATWHARIKDWIRRSDPADLLSVDIFFDLRPVHGDGALCIGVWQEAFDAARGEVGFAKLLAEAAGGVESALGLFGRFKTDRGRIDLKKAGLFGIVTTARVLAIRHHVVERATPDRLAGVMALGLGSEADLDALVEAQAVFLDLMLAQQIQDIAHGTPPSNAVAVRRLTRGERERLRAALAAVEHLDDLTRDLLFKD